MKKNKITINGFYNGFNLFVRNPTTTKGQFCINQMPMLKGRPVAGNINSSIFELKLNDQAHGLKPGDSISMVIEHCPGAEPKILNGEVIRKDYSEKFENVKDTVKHIKPKGEIKIEYLADRIKIRGWYNGKNIYIMNPYISENRFCVHEVPLINGWPTTDYVESSAYELDFTLKHIKVGDPVSVDIVHCIGCMPSVLNPEILAPCLRPGQYSYGYRNCDPYDIVQLVLTGVYNEKNIFIQNTLTVAGLTITECPRVNGIFTCNELPGPMFEIDLAAHGLKKGDKVEIAIKFKSCCMPVVLNPEAINPQE